MEGEGILQKLGKYDLTEKIGEGSIGVTYRSNDPMLDRPVAIKVLHARLTAEPGFIERFRKEARQMVSLRHPNIVTVLDVGEQDGSYYLVMDFLSGGSLQNIIQDGKTQSLMRTVEILDPVAEALDYAHSRSVVHGDLHPSNIMISDDGQVLVTDFSLIQAVAEKGITASGTVLGKSEYVAPEQIQGNSNTPATDLYSLGVIAFQLLAGRVPFTTPKYVDTFKMHLTQSPPDIRTINPAFPKALADTLVRSLAKDQSKRFTSAADFIATLEQIATQMNQEQMRTLYQAARDQMRLLKFDAAITSLDQVLAIRSSPEIETLLQECQRRKKICEEVQSLRDQINQSQGRLNQLLAAEQWLTNPSTNSKGKKLFAKK
jgi:serine/threonine-protein kinase